MGYKDLHASHRLWAVARDVDDELRNLIRTSDLDPETGRVSRLKALLEYVITFEQAPHPTINTKALDDAATKVEQIKDVLPDVDAAYSSRSGQSNSPAGYLIQNTRAWPQPAAARLTGLNRKADELDESFVHMKDLARNQAAAMEQDVTEELERVKATISQRAAKIEEAFENLETKIQENQQDIQHAEGIIETQKERLDTALTAHEDAFKDSESKRSKAWEHQLDEQQTAAAKHLDSMESHDDQSIKLLESIGVSATASHHGDYAERQRKVANRWRVGAVIALTAAGSWFVGVSIMGVLGFDVDSEWWQALFQRLGAPLGLAAVGAFCAREATQHRREERKANQTLLILVSLEPFIARLPKNQQETIRYLTAQALFTDADETPDLSKLVARDNTEQSASESDHRAPSG